MNNLCEKIFQRVKVLKDPKLKEIKNLHSRSLWRQAVAKLYCGDSVLSVSLRPLAFQSDGRSRDSLQSESSELSVPVVLVPVEESSLL